MASEVEKSLLVIILDINPVQKLVRQDTRTLTQCLDSVIVFANAHLMQKSNNQLAVMACNSQSSSFLYPDQKPPEVRQVDGQYEGFTLVERTVRQRLQKLVQEITTNKPLNSESLIAGALAMALCYIGRLEREKAAGEKLHSRVLVVTGSNDSASQYMNYMNVFFTAQKLGVVVDVCSLDQELTLLQQGCDITGGNYLKIPQLAGLLQYLLVKVKDLTMLTVSQSFYNFITQLLPDSSSVNTQ